MESRITKAATHSGANAFAAILLAAYLAIVAWQGNIGALFGQIKSDVVGTPQRSGFWKWAIAIVILYWLAENPATNKVFGPLLMVTLLAMLIDIASTQPQAFQNLNRAVATIFSASPQATLSTPAPSSSNIQFGGLLGAIQNQTPAYAPGMTPIS